MTGFRVEYMDKEHLEGLTLLLNCIILSRVVIPNENTSDCKQGNEASMETDNSEKGNTTFKRLCEIKRG